jgi:hypothetical protein
MREHCREGSGKFPPVRISGNFPSLHLSHVLAFHTFFRIATVTDLTPSSGRPRAVARHFAVVDAYCVDMFRAVSTCPSDPSSLSFAPFNMRPKSS